MKMVPFLEAFTDVSRGNKKIPSGEMLEEGQLPVIDQGAKLVAGYTNDPDAAVKSETPLIVFGDHTKVFKLIQHKFAMGADGIKLLKPSIELDSTFAYHYLRSIKLPDAGYSRHFKFLKERSVPLPPLDEQRRIAAILDKADAIRQKRRQAIAHLDNLALSIFQYMFRNSSRRAKLGDIFDVSTGSTPSRANPANFGGGIPWVKTGEVNGTITATEETVSQAGVKSSRLRIFPPMSIIIAMYGQGKTRGQSAILSTAATTNQACAVLPPNDSYYPEFIRTQLRSGYERLRGAARGGNQANLNLQIIRDFEVLVAPLELQAQFDAILSEIDRSKTRTKSALDMSCALFDSLQSRAFRGEL